MPSYPYSILKSVARASLGFYYHPIKVSRDEDLRAQNRPILIIAKHSNALMDAIVLGSFCKAELHFLARADVFQNKISRYFLSKLNMLPVYRAIDGVDVRTANHHIFEKVVEKLHQRKVVAVFPEGTHDRSKELKPLKKGFARLAWQYHLDHPGEFPLIVPVGIHYDSFEERHRGLNLHFGKFIDTRSIFESAEGETQALKKLTEEATGRLQDHTVLSENESVRQIMDILEEIHWKFGENDSIEVKQHYIRHLNQKQDSELSEIRIDLMAYKSILIKSGLHDSAIVKEPKASLMDDILAFLSLLWKGFHFPMRKAQQLVIKGIMTDIHFQSTFDYLLSFIFYPVYWSLVFFLLYCLGSSILFIGLSLSFVLLMIFQIAENRHEPDRIMKIRASILNRRKCSVYTAILKQRQTIKDKIRPL